EACGLSLGPKSLATLSPFKEGCYGNGLTKPNSESDDIVKGFAAVLAILKPERLKVDRARMCEEASKVESCPSEIILDDLLALDSIVPLKLILSVHRIRRRRYNLIPAESKFKNLVLDHQDKYMMKAQAEAVNTVCYVLNRALVIITHNKTPYELLNGRSPRLDFMRPFGCPVTILNTLDPLGKFVGKADEGFLVGYSVISLQDTYGNAGTQDNVDIRTEVSDQHHIMLPLWSSISSTYKNSDDKAEDDKPTDDTGSKTIVEPINKEDQAYIDELDRIMSQEKEASAAVGALIKEFEQRDIDQRGATKVCSTNSFNTVINPINIVSTSGTFRRLTSTTWNLPLFIQKFWRLVDLLMGRRLLKPNRQEEGIDYDQVFASVARIEAIRIFLAFASYMGFIVYQMYVNSAFLYGIIEEEVYVSQTLGFIDAQFPNKVYKVKKALYGGHQAPRACFDAYKIPDEFHGGAYFLLRTAACRPDIMFAVYACSRFRVTPKLSHLQAVKRIFRYLKCQPKLGLWYPRDSPYDPEAYSDSDYAGANLDRKSTIGVCQFFGRRLISCQCKKQTIVATSTTEAEYVAAANCYGQVLWIQNQMQDYVFNFMNTKIYIDNENTIYIVKNPVYHLKTSTSKLGTILSGIRMRRSSFRCLRYIQMTM
nr:uncharacterized mitochondrial protein AtMg00810-like [Tanacetum cinerariifolium]